MSLLLDALQRASREKEKLAEARSSGNEPSLREPLPQLEPRSDVLQAMGTELSIEPLALKPPAEEPLARPLDPVIALSLESLEPVHAVAVSAPDLEQASAKVRPDLNAASTASDPLPADTASAAMSGKNTNFIEGVTGEMAASTPLADKSPPMPPPVQVPVRAPGELKPKATYTESRKEASNPRSKEASPEIAREILGATIKRRPSRRLAVLGLLGVLTVGAYLAFFLGAFDRFLGLPASSLTPPTSPSPAPTTASAPVASVPANPVIPAAPDQSPAPTEMALSRLAEPGMERAANPRRVGTKSTTPAAALTGSEGDARESPRRGTSKQNRPIVTSRAPTPGDLDLAYVALTEGRFDEAKLLYRKVLQKTPAERDALLGLAYIEHRQGNIEQARNYYQQVLRLEPGHAGANAGMLAIAPEGDLSQAGSRAREMAERMPDSAAALSTLAGILVREGRIAEAQQAYFKALTIEPENALHAYNLAVALDRMHKYPLARTYYHRAIALAEKSVAADRAGVPLGEAQRRLDQLLNSGGEGRAQPISGSVPK